jgi:hypothetical protein
LLTGFGRSATAGDYPIVFVRTLSDDKPTKFVIEADGYLFAIEFRAPQKFEIAGVIDGDGD